MAVTRGQAPWRRLRPLCLCAAAGLLQHWASAADPHSCANFEDVVVTHLHPKLRVDFRNRDLVGVVSLRADVLRITGVLKLDIGHNVTVQDVRSPGSASPLRWKLSQAAFGMCLEIELKAEQATVGNSLAVDVQYKAVNSDGLGWLDASATISGHGLMYSQFQAILARTALPCQDTPSVKATYNLSLTVPAPLVVVASARPLPKSGKGNTFEFMQPVPVMSYLIAFAVGQLERAELGPHSSVWAERATLRKAKQELVHMEKYVEIGKKLVNHDYVWGSADILVLPAAFPYGGMENPNLIFLNACLLGGELLNVVIHEVTHSWVGNLVTNALWKDYWLNEGFAVYMERLMISEMEGEGLRYLHSVAGYKDLEQDVALFSDKPEWTKLCADLSDVDPDEAFSKVPYEKGYLLLLLLEKLAGKEKMVQWLQTYVNAFAMKSITTEDFLGSVRDFMPDVAQQVDWDTWLYKPGMPDFRPSEVFSDTALVDETAAATTCWAEREGRECPRLAHPFQKIELLSSLRSRKAVLPIETLRDMEKELAVKTANVALQFQWLCFCLEQRNQAAFDLVWSDLARFLFENGRFAYVRAIFTEMWKLATLGITSQDKVRRLADANQEHYHSVVNHFLKGLLSSAIPRDEL